jgi:hypothetical protein
LWLTAAAVRLVVWLLISKRYEEGWQEDVLRVRFGEKVCVVKRRAAAVLGLRRRLADEGQGMGAKRGTAGAEQHGMACSTQNVL